MQLELTKCNDDLSKANDEKRSRIIVDRTLSSFNPTEINIPYRDHFNLSDSDTKVDASTLTDEGSTKSKRDAIISQLADLETLKNTLPTLKKRYESNIQKLEEIKKLNDFREELNRLYPNSLEERNKEFSAIKNISKTQFNISDATYNPQACVNPTLRF
ncbi:hypothetical protein IJM86_05430 [bacterium]|nr:hypothetical protein [bacterium]